MFALKFARSVQLQTIQKHGLRFTRVDYSKLNLVKSQNTLLTQKVVNDQLDSGTRRKIGFWLLSCSGITFGTILIGGITRLTKSGLSIVDWHPFKEFPPFNHEAWQKEFEKYQQYPEYKQKNGEMSLSEFKRIWYMEYAHRMLGRTIGAMFLLPAAYFWSKGYFNGPMKKRVLALGGLLMFQGFLGWYMVKSGLDDEMVKNYADPRVSHYRLASHLGTALIFYSLLFWNGLAHVLPPTQAPITSQMVRFRRFAHAGKSLVFLTALSGALVAGIDAGLTYNSWPKMADKWIPDDILARSPTWKNFFENPTTVQFDHRRLGELTYCVLTAAWLYSRRLPLSPRMRNAINCVQLAATAQVVLGITTLLTYVPTSMASIHQAGALTLLSTAIWLTHELKFIKYLPK